MTDSAKRARLIELLTQRSFERRKVILASGKESDFFIDFALVDRQEGGAETIRAAGLPLVTIATKADFP